MLNPKYVKISNISFPPTKILLAAPNIIINPFPIINAIKHIIPIKNGFLPYFAKLGVVIDPLIYEPITIFNPTIKDILSFNPKEFKISADLTLYVYIIDNMPNIKITKTVI